jgi:hypothetical protein
MTYEIEAPAKVTFTGPQKSAFRSALTKCPQWESYRLSTGKSAADLTTKEMLALAEQWGIDAAAYGNVQGSGYTPKPRTVPPVVFDNLKNLLATKEANGQINAADAQHCHDILRTIYSKQDGWGTEKQRASIERDLYKPMEAPKAEPLPPFRKALDLPEAPTPAPASEAERDIAQAIAAAVAGVLAGHKGGTDEGRVIELIKEHGGRPAHVTFDLRAPALPDRKGEGLFHYRFPLLLAAVNAGVNVMLVGGAGSGKTTAAEQVAETLGLPFYFTGAIDSAYKLSGFIDAQGRIVSTSFRKAYEFGGVFLFDEMDASLAGAVLAFNAALANGQADFPDGMIKRHPDFRAIAATNTFGRGADRQYVGRLQLDAASLDRFACLAWDYDSAMEAALIGAPVPDGAPSPASVLPMTDPTAIQRESNRWIERVRNVRAKAEAQKVRHIVSPRATVMGAKLLAAGWQWNEVEESCMFKGLDSDSRDKIK